MRFFLLKRKRREKRKEKRRKKQKKKKKKWWMNLGITQNLTETGHSDIRIRKMQIPAHLTTHSAKSRSVFPDITERVSASADQ